MKRLRHLLATALLLGAHGSILAQQQLWDAAGDFWPGVNPNGAWSYGAQTPSGTFSRFPVLLATCGGTSQLACWTTSAGWTFPLVGRNESGAPIVQTSVVLPLAVLDMHPDPTLRAAVVFTAPTAGTYVMTGQFQAADRTPTGVQVIILRGSNTMLSALLTAFGMTKTFNFTRTLKAGERITFLVDSAGNYANDSTSLTASVTRL